MDISEIRQKIAGIVVKGVWLKRVITNDGSIPPTGYRLAWINWMRHEYIYLPFGIHWIARTARKIWLWTFIFNEDEWDKASIRIGNSYRDRIEELESEVVYLEDEITSLLSQINDHVERIDKSSEVLWNAVHGNEKWSVN